MLIFDLAQLREKAEEFVRSAKPELGTSDLYPLLNSLYLLAHPGSPPRTLVLLSGASRDSPFLRPSVDRALTPQMASSPRRPARSNWWLATPSTRGCLPAEWASSPTGRR